MSGLSKPERGYAPDENSDPIAPLGRNHEAFYNPTKESASNFTESIREVLQPGDTKATTRRLSDTPSNTQPTKDWLPKPSSGAGLPESQRRQDQEREEMESKDILLHAQESAAKALGGGSRGASG